MSWTLTHENEEIQELQGPGTDPTVAVKHVLHTLCWTFCCFGHLRLSCLVYL